MIPIGDIISNAFGAVKEIFGWKREEAQRQNTPEMQANAKAAQDAKVVDDARAAAAKADLEETRRKLS